MHKELDSMLEAAIASGKLGGIAGQPYQLTFKSQINAVCQDPACPKQVCPVLVIKNIFLSSN